MVIIFPATVYCIFPTTAYFLSVTLLRSHLLFPSLLSSCPGHVSGTAFRLMFCAPWDDSESIESNWFHLISEIFSDATPILFTQLWFGASTFSLAFWRHIPVVCLDCHKVLDILDILHLPFLWWISSELTYLQLNWIFLLTPLLIVPKLQRFCLKKRQ